MNVSRNAYFTSEYLEELQKSPRSYRDGTSYRSKQRSPRSYNERPSPTSTRTNLDNIDPIENPDELTEEITPAELTYLSQRLPYRSQRQLVDYYDYYKPRNGLRSPVKRRRSSTAFISHDSESLSSTESSGHHAMPGRGDFSGYYIDQKKKIDAAKEVKPAFYTHKTFKDVFEKDTDERLNPIDIVFTDTEKLKEQNDRRVLSKAFKKVQKTVGYDDYTSYDYFEQMRKRGSTKKANSPSASNARPSSDIKLTTNSKSKMKTFFGLKKELKDERDADCFSSEEKADLADLENPFNEQRPPKSKSMRSKWKLLKKTKGPEEEREEPPSAMPGTPVDSDPELVSEIKEDVTIEPELESGSIEGSLGPQEKFLPLWNTLLSWIVYERIDDPTETARNINKIEELNECDVDLQIKDVEEKSRFEKFSTKDLLNAKRYKQILSRWNDPASKYLINPPKFLEKRRIVSNPHASSDLFLEFEVDFGDDENLAEELIYNPRTGQLEELVSCKSRYSDVRLPSALRSGTTPVTIISSVNKLVKNIGIMKILFAPIDVIGENFPRLQTLVIILELFIFVWILYELSLLIDALCMAIKAICAPMIAVGRFMNRIM